MSEVDQGNLSKKLKKLEENSIIIIEKKKGGRGRPHSIISLEPDTRKLIEVVIEQRGIKKELPLIPKIEYLDEILHFLEEGEVSHLAADQIEIISNKYAIPISSRFFEVINQNIMKKKFEKVAPTLLRSLLNILRNSDHKMRKKIVDDMNFTIKLVRNKKHGTPEGKIAQDILEEFLPHFETYEELVKRYISLIGDGSSTVLEVRRHIEKRFPESKIDLRFRLIQIYKKSDEETRRRIESKFSALH